MDEKLINIDGDEPIGRPPASTAHDEVAPVETGQAGRTGTEGHEATSGKSSAGTWPWTKRERLQRHSSVSGTVDVDDPLSKKSSAPSSAGSRQDYFGVRSYLHHFYEAHGSNLKSRYTYRDARKQKCSRGHCGGYWWKTMAMFGAGCLTIGIVTISIGFLIPQRPVIIGPAPGDDTGRQLIDRDAARFDLRLEICRLVGLTMFCAGGLILAVALMIPTFLYRYCGGAGLDGVVDDDPVMIVDVGTDDDEEMDPDEQAPALPVKADVVPVTERVTEVQPPRKVGETTMIGQQAYD